MTDERYARFPDGFFGRTDETTDTHFYDYPRIVTHIDDAAIAMVSALYDELGLSGPDAGHQLDLMSSWISHFSSAPTELTVLGMNAPELERNTQATHRVVHDLNTSPILPFNDNTFDGAMCCVSVDYLTRPIEVFDEVARVLKPGRPFVPFRTVVSRQKRFGVGCKPMMRPTVRSWPSTSVSLPGLESRLPSKEFRVRPDLLPAIRCSQFGRPR
jgi:SAM-dependent methyltransferase